MISQVFLKKSQLIGYAFLEVFPCIDIKVTDWIIFRFCILPQLFFSFFSSAFWRYTIMFAYLKQDRATYFMDIFDRPVFVTS